VDTSSVRLYLLQQKPIQGWEFCCHPPSPPYSITWGDVTPYQIFLQKTGRVDGEGGRLQGNSSPHLSPPPSSKEPIPSPLISSTQLGSLLTDGIVLPQAPGRLGRPVREAAVGVLPLGPAGREQGHPPEGALQDWLPHPHTGWPEGAHSPGALPGSGSRPS